MSVTCSELLTQATNGDVSVCFESAAIPATSIVETIDGQVGRSMKASTATSANAYICSSIHSASESKSSGRASNTLHISTVTRRAFEPGRADPTALVAVPLRPCLSRADNLHLTSISSRSAFVHCLQW